MKWSQWAGIVQRESPETLVLFKTTCRSTKRNAPGPGAITKRDWIPAAEKWLLGKHVILHTDGARLYKVGISRKTFVDGVIHDFVVHRNKKINGKWRKGKFV